MSLATVQQEIGAQARRYFERRALPLAADGPDDQRAQRLAQWRQMAELGWLGAAIPEALGGYGGEAELVVLAQEAGAALAVDPFLEGAVFPAVFLAHARLEGAHADLLEQVIDASARITAVAGEPGAEPPVRFRERGGRLHLSGQARGVLGCEDAGHLLVCAAAADAPERRRVLLIERDAARPVFLPTIDGRWIADFDLNGLNLAPEAALGDQAAVEAFELAHDAAILGQCGELVGLMERAFALTRDYLQTRRQFGQPLSGFQALRHRLADMFAELELARAILDLGVGALREGPMERRRWAVSACKLRIGRAARFVGAQAIQLHGAIAMTEEYLVGRCYKRILAARKTWGDEEAHARRMAQNRPASPFGLEEA